jgi:hypothetical protein
VSATLPHGSEIESVGGRPPAIGRPRAAAGHPGRWLFLALVVAVATAGVLIAVLPLDVNDVNAAHWTGHLTALAAIVAIFLLLGGIRRYATVVAAREAGQQVTMPAGILIGADNRLSTSKLAAFAWTWTLAWAMLSLAIANWVGQPAGWDALVDGGLYDEYLILLGGPFVALVGAKALVQGRVASGDQVKSEATGDQTVANRVSQAFSNDSGQTDLVDSQYLIFTALSLTVFVVMFVTRDAGGLPRLPDLLVGLSSVGATAYVANKFAVADAPPHLDRVVPGRAAPGDQIVIYGRNLLKVSQGGSTANQATDVDVIFGSVGLTSIRDASRDPLARTSPSGSDSLTVTVPQEITLAATADGDVEAPVSIRNAIGVLSDNELAFTIARPPEPGPVVP